VQRPTDTAMVTAAQAGNRRALDRLLADHLPLVYNVVGRALSGHADTDDVVQETMLRAMHGLGSLRDPASFRYWLLAIAMRQVHERGRARRATHARGPVLDPTTWEVEDPGADFADVTIERLGLSGQRRETAEAARWLDASDRELLSLWWLEAAGEITRTDLARTMGLSLPHAAVRVQRMKSQLELARVVVRAWSATPRCPRLSEAARRWDGRPGPLWRKRLARHTRDCAGCGRYGAGLVPTERLLVGLSLVPVPVGLAGYLLAGAKGYAAVAHGGVGSAVATTVLGRLPRALKYLVAKPTTAVTTAATAGAVAIAGVAVTFAVYVEPIAPAIAVAPAAPSTVSALPPASPSPSGNPSVSPTAAPVSGVSTADIYVAPNGNDANAGTLANPYATLNKAASVVKPGQTIALRGGVYQPTGQTDITTDATATKRITLSNYADETPILDGTRVASGTRFLTMSASYWTVQGLEIRNVKTKPFICGSCQYDIFRRLRIHDNLDTGFQLSQDNTIGNQILDSDFYLNHDDATLGENADGIGIKFGSGSGNVVKRCRMFNNSDDGLDVWAFTSAVTIDSSWAYGNGVNRWNVEGWQGNGVGFKLGGAAKPVPPVDHVVRNSAAWANAGDGFTEDSNPGALTMTNNTSYANGDVGFDFHDSSSTLSKNIALSNNRDVVLNSAVKAAGNSWNGSGWTVSVFMDTNPATAQGPRRGDGQLPTTTFLVNTKDPHIGASMTG
jgi:RNA polymerase sigma factor (sigma-70 family)